MNTTYKTWHGSFQMFAEILNRYEKDGWLIEEWRIGGGSDTYAVFVKYEGVE